MSTYRKDQKCARVRSLKHNAAQNSVAPHAEQARPERPSILLGAAIEFKSNHRTIELLLSSIRLFHCMTVKFALEAVARAVSQQHGASTCRPKQCRQYTIRFS